MTIISVTDESTGEEIFINANYVIRFYQKSGSTYIRLQDTDNPVYIKESAQWLYERINYINQ